jgi:hypothetical protein
MADRFDKFTERARMVLQLAQEDAQRFNHDYIGSEHILLGLVREGGGVAATVLANLGVELTSARSAVESAIGRADPAARDVGLTPQAKKVIELSVDEARRLNHRSIGTEHLLLGLIREGEGIGAGVLESLGVSLDRARSRVLELLNRPVAAMPDVLTGPPPAMQELVGVVPIAQTQAHGGTVVTLFSVELYADGFVVHGRIRREDRRPLSGAGASRQPVAQLRAGDERGGRYEARPGRLIGSDYDREWRFMQSFGPGVDPAARELRLDIAEVNWRRSEEIPSMSERTDVHPGPWAFTIPLPPPPGG